MLYSCTFKHLEIKAGNICSFGVKTGMLIHVYNTYFSVVHKPGN